MGYLVSMESSFYSIYLSTFFSKILGLIIYEPLFFTLIVISSLICSLLGSYSGLLISCCSFFSSTGTNFFYFTSISTGLLMIFTFFIASAFFKDFFFDELFALFFLCF
jgi:hypothetical protein